MKGNNNMKNKELNQIAQHSKKAQWSIANQKFIT